MPFARLRAQIEEARSPAPFITCRGKTVQRKAWTDGSDHGLEVPLWMAIRCLYCGFWFCRSCAHKHFTGIGFHKERSEFEELKDGD